MPQFKYKLPPKTLFMRNRKKFAEAMAPGHIAVFFANDLVLENGDYHFPFRQNSNTYYLTGLDQEKVFLILFPDAPREEWKEMLFIRKTNARIQTWDGWKYNPYEAQVSSGIKMIKFDQDFERMVRMLLPYAEGVYIDVNEHEYNTVFNYSSSHEFAERVRREFPGHPIRRSAQIFRKLRMIKEPEEIVQLRAACDITEKAFRRTLEFVEPGVWEYEIEAEVLREFHRNRATGAAYQSIIATGKNACILHYVRNSNQCQDGELVLFDFGAEYGNYSADVSRTIPVNGRFTDRQKDVYNAVLRVMRHAISMLRPGVTLNEYHDEIGNYVEGQLIELGVLSKEEVAAQNPNAPLYKQYYMHVTSHHLGLDTHDFCDRHAPLAPGMVLTVEPGIYLQKESMGIRLENDVMVTDGDPVDLTETIPVEVEEIEALMNQREKAEA